MRNALFVGLGGFLGSVLRYVLTGLVADRSVAGRLHAFPIRTLLVNVLGCFTIGLLAQFAEVRGALSAHGRAFVVIGFLGGFTTFSSFGKETMDLWRGGGGALAE